MRKVYVIKPCESFFRLYVRFYVGRNSENKYIHTHSYVKFKARVKGEKYKHRSVLILFPLHSLPYGLFELRRKGEGPIANSTFPHSIKVKRTISVLCEC